MNKNCMTAAFMLFKASRTVQYIDGSCVKANKKWSMSLLASRGNKIGKKPRDI
jgi:hypothetical protein